VSVYSAATVSQPFANSYANGAKVRRESLSFSAAACLLFSTWEQMLSDRGEVTVPVKEPRDRQQRGLDAQRESSATLALVFCQRVLCGCGRTRADLHRRLGDNGAACGSSFSPPVAG
jgi:hypothetical protein